MALGPCPRVYVFTHSCAEWETARLAMKHLLQLGRLSPRSYLEGNLAGFDQGLSAQNLDGMPHGPGLVAQFRDAAIRAQNDEEGVDVADDLFLLFVLAAKERREQSARECDEEEEWREEDEEERSAEDWTEEAEELEEADPGEDQYEEPIQEVPAASVSHLITLALARWRKGEKTAKRRM